LTSAKYFSNPPRQTRSKICVYEREKESLLQETHKEGKIVNMRGDIRRSPVDYKVLQGEGKVEGEKGGGAGSEVEEKRGAIRVIDEAHVAEGNVQVDAEA